MLFVVSCVSNGIAMKQIKLLWLVDCQHLFTHPAEELRKFSRADNFLSVKMCDCFKHHQ